MYDEAPSILPAQENIVLAYRDWLTDVMANPMWPRPGLRYSLYGKGEAAGGLTTAGSHSRRGM